MDVKHINPFIESVDNVFTTMLDMQPKRNAVKVANQNGHDRDLATVTSLIGISGQMTGMVVLRFPPDTALRIASRFLGTEFTEMSDEVVDAVSELVNMVAGSAKAKFEHDPPLELGLPTVVEGGQYRVKYPSKSVWLEVPFSTDIGDFSLEVTYNPR